MAHAVVSSMYNEIETIIIYSKNILSYFLVLLRTVFITKEEIKKDLCEWQIQKGKFHWLHHLFRISS